MTGEPHKSWFQYFAIMAREYKENLQMCLDTWTRGKTNRATGLQMTLAISAMSLPEMPNVQHRTKHCRLDEQQEDDHGVNIVSYGDWAHKQGLDLPQREDPPLGVVNADQGIWQAPYMVTFVRTPGVGGMHHRVTVRPRGTPTELLNDSMYQGMKVVAQKKQEQAQFEREQLDRRKEEIAEEQGKLDTERAEMNADMNRKIAAAEAREKE